MYVICSQDGLLIICLENHTLAYSYGVTWAKPFSVQVYNTLLDIIKEELACLLKCLSQIQNQLV